MAMKIFAYRDHLLNSEPGGRPGSEYKKENRRRPLEYGCTYYFVTGANRKNADPVWEDIRDHFASEFMNDEYFSQFDYHRSGLSVSAFELLDVEIGDFLFEMGELGSARIKYHGHYHAKTGALDLHIFGGFDESGLWSLLRDL